MNFVKELLLEIIRQCDLKDRFNLSQTSHVLHKLCIPLLYKSVDLSTHNRKGMVPTGRAPFETLADNPNRTHCKLDVAIFWRQQAFIRTLVDRPEYGKFVNSFTWSLLYTPEMDDDWNAISVDAWSDGVLWKVFQSFTNVMTVDIGFLRHYREIEIPPPLFTSAMSARLLGHVSKRTAEAVLHSIDPMKLLHLALDNLQNFGKMSEGEDLPWSIRASSPNRSETPESLDPEERRRGVYPGPMRGHLRYLEGRCTVLKSLTLRSVGQDSIQQSQFSTFADEQRYEEWASFLKSVQPSLERLYFEQGVIQGNDKNYWRPGHKPRQDARPMDARFIRYLLPVILDGPWPNLRHLEIRGVGRWDEFVEPGVVLTNVALDDATRERIGLAVGPNVKVVIDEAATQTFEFCS